MLLMILCDVNNGKLRVLKGNRQKSIDICDLWPSGYENSQNSVLGIRESGLGLRNSSRNHCATPKF